jgi:hypothetical protein
MSGFFKDEASRAFRFREILRDSGIDASVTKIEGTKFITDGDVQSQVHDFPPLAVSDAHNLFRCPYQLLCCYLGHSSERTGALDALPLFFHHTDSRMRAMAARHFGALRNALHWLKECYDEELSDIIPPTRLILNLEFPYPLSYTGINTSTIHHFRYLSHMNDSKLLFAAETVDGERICVKFIRHYSKDVRNFCASKGFAPTLEGFEELPGRWHMVVMEMIADDYCSLMDFPPPYSHYDDIIGKLASSPRKLCSWRCPQHEHYGEEGREPGIQARGF